MGGRFPCGLLKERGVRRGWKGCAALLVVALAIPLTASAQGTVGDASREGRGYLLLGGSLLDVDRINSELGAAGHPQFREGAFSIGGGVHTLHGPLVFGAEGHGIIGMSRSEAGASFESRLTGGYALLNVGWTAVRRGGFTAYPLMGLGAGGVNVRLTERAAPTFSELMEDPGRISDLR